MTHHRPRKGEAAARINTALAPGSPVGPHSPGGLGALTPRDRAGLLARACEELANEANKEEVLHNLARESDLSPAMVRWSIDTSVRNLTREEWFKVWAGLEENCRGRIATGPAQHFVWLAHSVLSAPLRALGVPLMLGIPVKARLPSRESLFARLFHEALCKTHEALGKALVLEEGRDDIKQFFEGAESADLYGSDQVLAQIEAQLPPSCRYQKHGHGLGVAVLPHSENGIYEEEASLEAFSLDVAAYDQLGCLSPQALFVDDPSPGQDRARKIAQTLCAQLAAREQTLPRGELSSEAQGRIHAWRAVAQVRGTLFQQDHAAVSVESGDMRPSPGYRNITVIPYAGQKHLFAYLNPLGLHLKTLALPSTDTNLVHSFHDFTQLPFPLAPALCKLGYMQRPPVDLWPDGETLYAMFRFFDFF